MYKAYTHYVVMRDAIFESLDNAISNGYELLDWPNAEIAEDLAEYDASFNEVPVAVLIPFVAMWRAKHTNHKETT